MTARLPVVGGDNSNWGTLLNQFLQVAHNNDGTLKNIFNVKDYGAVGDSVTDDTAAIHSATTSIDAVGSGVLYFPDGIYKIASTLNITANVKLEFAPGAMLMIKTGTSVAIACLEPFNVRWFGAINGTAATGSACSISSGSTSLTVNTIDAFKIGGGIMVPGAGASGANLYTRILAINGLIFTLEDAAATTVSGVRCLADNSIAINSAIQAMPNAVVAGQARRGLYFPGPDVYQICQPLVYNKGYFRTYGDHHWASVIIAINGADAIQIGNTSGGHVGGSWTWEHLTFFVDTSTAWAFNTPNTNQLLIDSTINNCWFGGNGSAGATGGAIKARISTLTIANCIIELLRNGIVIKDNSSWLNASNIISYEIVNKVLSEDTGATTVSSINIDNWQHIIASKQVGGSGPAFINMTSVTGLNISNVIIRNITPTATSPTATFLLVGIGLFSCSRINLSNIIIRDAIGHDTTFGAALYLSNCNQVNVKNFHSYGDISTGYRPEFGIHINNSSNITIDGFSIEGTLEEGIKLRNTCTNVSIEQGYITKTGELAAATYAMLKFPTAGQTRVRAVRFVGDGNGGTYSDNAFDLSAITSGVRKISDCDYSNVSVTTAMYAEIVGLTSNRPVAPEPGQYYFDTTLGKPIWHNGSAWKDATGTTV